MSSKNIQYQPGKIRALVERVALYAAKNPEQILQTSLTDQGLSGLHAVIADKVDKGYNDDRTCFNCGRGMRLTIHTLGVSEAILGLMAARLVRYRVSELGTEYDRANSLDRDFNPPADTIRNLTHLGFLERVAGKRSQWRITTAGWHLVCNYTVPRSAATWGDALVSRGPEMTNIESIFKTYMNTVDRKEVLDGTVSEKEYQWREIIKGYRSADWVAFYEQISKPVPGPGYQNYKD